MLKGLSLALVADNHVCYTLCEALDGLAGEARIRQAESVGMKRIVSQVAALFLLFGCCTGGAYGQSAEELVERSNVFVLVSSNNGWGKFMTAALSCDGHFRIVGAYSDTTAIRGSASPDSALSFINELLAMNFFEQPGEFKSSRTQLRSVGGGKLAELWENTMDAGSTRIELHVGERVHAVVLAYPAYGAPEQLRVWATRFGGYMKEVRGW